MPNTIEYLPLVRKIAYNIRRRLPAWMELDPLIQSGVVGLLDARARYAPAKGVTFATYAYYRIQGEIFEYVRSLDWASRAVRIWGRRLNTASSSC